MKLLPARLLAALFGLAGLLSTPLAASAATYAAGDLLLGVRATGDPGATTNVVVDLGPASQFLQATDPFTVTNLGADFTSIFSEAGGVTWSSRSDLYWGVVGTDLASDPTNTLYATRPRTDASTLSTPWDRRSYSAQSVTNSTYRSFASGYALSSTNASTPKGVLQSSTGTNSYSQFASNGADFNVYSNIEGDFAHGTQGSVLDLYRLTPTTQNAQGAGVIYVGSFQFSDSGALTFSPAAPTQPLFRLTASNYPVNEDAGSVTVTVQRFGIVSGTDSVTIATANGSAVAGTDYTTVSQTLTFAPSETSEDVTINITNIPGLQANRSFTVALSNASTGADLRAPSTATVAITDTEPQNFGTVAFSAATYSVAPVDSEASPSSVAVTLTRTNGTDGAVSVSVAQAAGSTLVSGTDFTGVSSTPQLVSFAAGQATQTVTIQLNAIAANKLPGTIKLALSNPQGGVTLGSITNATVTVTALDKVKPTVALTTKAGRTTDGTLVLAGSAKDNVAISRVEVRVNGGAVQYATLGAPVAGKYSFNLSGIALENGLNLVVVTPYDASGNAGAATTLRLTYANTRPELAGNYNGLITPSSTPSIAKTGFIKATVTATGLFTGQVSIGSYVVPIKGTFDNSGQAHFNVLTTTTAAATTLALNQKVGAAITAYGTLALSIVADKITGTITGSDDLVAAAVSADRAVWDGKNTVPDPNYLSSKGLYTVIFPARNSEVGLTSSQYPQGDGYGTLRITNKGLVTVIGTLADGTAVSSSATISKTYELPFYSKLTGGGLISGPVTFDYTKADTDAKGTNLVWLRPAVATSKYYPQGWTSGILIDLLAAKYVVTPGTAVIPGLAATSPNADVTLTDGKLTANVDKQVTISTHNVVTVTPVDHTFTLALQAAAGSFTGKFKHTDGTSPAYKGAIYQKGSLVGGYGYFLSTVPVHSTNGESGAAQITPISAVQ